MKRPVKLLTYRDLQDRGLRFSRRHLDRLEAANAFPRRVPIGEHKIGWVEEEIEKHIAGLVRARDAKFCEKSIRRRA